LSWGRSDRDGAAPSRYTAGMKHRERDRSVGFVAAALLAGMGLSILGGCSTTPAPVLRVLAVREVDSTPAGRVLAIEIEADNSGEEALPLREIEYSVIAGGRKVFTASRSPEATLRRFGTQTITVPAVVPPESIASGQPVRVEGRLWYVVPGPIQRILFDVGVSRPNVELSGERVVNAPPDEATSR